MRVWASESHPKFRRTHMTGILVGYHLYTGRILGEMKATSEQDAIRRAEKQLQCKVYVSHIED